LNGKTALFNRDKDDERKRLLTAAGYRVFFVWECSVLAQLATDAEMAEFFDEQTDRGGPLFPRDAFQVNSYHTHT
jgi:G:T-mismatch repair DNA endonuclease (very short patch repair protein)